MADEVSEAFRFSYGLLAAYPQLSGLVGTHIYQWQAPQGIFEKTPHGLYILGVFMSGEDVPGNGGMRLATDITILWRVMKRGQSDGLMREAGELMDAALTSVRAETSGPYVFNVVRASPFDRVTHDAASNPSSELGGFYDYTVSPRPVV